MPGTVRPASHAALSTGNRKQRKRARKALFAAARTEASRGLSGVVVQRDQRVSARCRELVLAGKGGAGVARTYFTRDADDIPAIHERLVIDPKGYRGTSIVLRNAALDPKHLADLFAD